MQFQSCFLLLALVSIVVSQSFTGYINLNYAFQPYGIAYLDNYNGQTGFLVSSLTPNNGKVYLCYDNATCTIFADGGGNLAGTTGLLLDTVDGVLYAGSTNSSGPNYLSTAAIVALNLTDGALIWSADFTRFGQAGRGKFISTLAGPDSKGTLYAAESVQGLVFAVTHHGTPSLFASGSLLQPVNFGLGASGIVYISTGSDEFLLVGVSGTFNSNSPLVRVPLKNPNNTMSVVNITNSNVVYGFDGLYYDNYTQYLYAISTAENLVFRLASSDNWQTAQLVSDVTPRCPGSPPSTIVHIDHTKYAGSAYVLCPNGLAVTGPYQIENIQFSKQVYYYPENYGAASALSCVVALASLLLVLAL